MVSSKLRKISRKSRFDRHFAVSLRPLFRMIHVASIPFGQIAPGNGYMPFLGDTDGMCFGKDKKKKCCKKYKEGKRCKKCPKRKD